MLQNNRAIDRGYGATQWASVGLEVAFAAALGLFPVNDNPMAAMQPTKKQSNILPPVPAVVNTDAIAGVLNEFGPATVEPVSGSGWEPWWNRWVSRHQYMGYQRRLGHRIKYFASFNDRPVAALSWSAPALKLAARDRFIGWSLSQRKRHLHQLAANSRFLILPWVQIPNLASHVLALNIARLPWFVKYYR
jgi:hypothetical protein